MTIITTKIQDPIFKARVHFISNCTHQEAVDYLKTKNIEEDVKFFADADGIMGTVDIVEKGGAKSSEYYVWIRSKGDLPTLVHETLHLVKQIFKDRDVPFNCDNDETMCYYQGYWVDEFTKLLKGKNFAQVAIKGKKGRS